MYTGTVNYKKILEDISNIEGINIVLRPFVEDDAKGVFEYASDPDVTKYLTWFPHEKIEQSLEAIKLRYINNPAIFAIIDKDENYCVGCIDIRIDETNSKASFGYCLSRRFWGKGYMSEALSLIIDLSFKTLKLNRVESTHYVGNEASGRVMEKCGMIKEGVAKKQLIIKGEAVDVVHYGIIRGELA